MPTQRKHAATRAADIAQQTLDDRSRTNDLHAGRVVRPTDGIAKRSGAFATRIMSDGFTDAQERCPASSR